MKPSRKRSPKNGRHNSRTKSRIHHQLVYEALEQRQMLTASLGFNTIGADFSDVGIDSLRPNPEGDVGPNHYVEFGEQTFTVYNRDGTIAESSNLNQFFLNASADIRDNNLLNPRVLFDRGSQRWFVTATGDGEGPLAGNWIHVAFSNTSDPTGQWRQVQFVPDVTGVGLHNDISLGVDADGVYLSTRRLINDDLDSVSIFSIPKADLFLANPTIANLTRFDNLSTNIYGERIQFASNFEASDGTMFAFSNLNFAILNSFQIVGAGSAAATLTLPENIVLDTNNNINPLIFTDPMSPVMLADPRPIDQPLFDATGALINSERITQPHGLTSGLIESNGSIYGVRTVSVAFNPAADFRVNGINWFQLTVTSGTPTLAASAARGTVSHVIIDQTFLGTPGDDDGDLVPEFGRVTYFNPSIAVTDAGLVAVVYNGATTFDAALLGNVVAGDFGNVDPLTGQPVNPSAARNSVYASVGVVVNNHFDLDANGDPILDMDGIPVRPHRSVQLEDPALIRYSLAVEPFTQPGLNLWGGYSSIRPDPNNPNAFFAVVPYAGIEASEWEVLVAEILPTELRPVIEATSMGDTIVIRRQFDNTDFVEIEINGLVTDRFEDSILDQLIIFAHAGDDLVVIDHVNGDPTPVNGFVISGGAGFDTIETNTAEDIEYLINTLNATVDVFFPSYLFDPLANFDGGFFPINDTTGPADGFLTHQTLSGNPIPMGDLVASQLLDIETVISGSGDDTFIFLVGPMAGDAIGRDGDDRFRFVGNGSVDGSINGGAGFNTFDIRDRDAATEIQLFATGLDAGFNGRTVNGPIGQFNEVIDQFRDISLIQGSIISFEDSIQALNQLVATYTVVIANINPIDVANPADANSFIATTLEQSGRTLFLTDFDILRGSVLDDFFNVQSNDLATLALVGRTGDDEFNFSSDAPINDGTVANIGGVIFVEGNGGANRIVVSDKSAFDEQDFLVLAARISGPVEVVYSATNSGTFDVTIFGSETAADTFILQSFLPANSLTVHGLGGNDIFQIQDLSQSPVELLGGPGDDLYIIEQVSGVDDRNVLIIDSLNAEQDRALLVGTELDDVFIVDLTTFDSDQFTFIGVEEFGIEGRGGDDEFHVRAISTNFPLFISGGSGNDTFHLSSDAPVDLGTLANFNNDLSIEAGTGINRIIISNEAGGALDAEIRSSQIIGLFNGVLNYTAEGGVFGLVDANGNVDSQNFGGITITGSNGGNDTFRITSFLEQNSLRINGRLGDDEFIVGDNTPTQVGGVIVLDGASGSDSYSLFLASLQGQNVIINDSGFAGVDVIDVRGTDGADTIALTQSGIAADGQNIEVSDTIEQIIISGGGGNDSISISGSPAELATLLGDAGNDLITVNGSVGVTDLQLFGGLGNDQILIVVSSAATAIQASGSDGDDLFDIRAEALGNIVAEGQAGSDRYLVRYVGSGSRLVSILDGGLDAGTDDATLSGNMAANVFGIDNTRVTLGGEMIVFGTMLEALEVRGGGGTDTFNLTQNVIVVTLDGGSGNDIFNLSSTAPATTGTTNGILANVNVNGGTGSNQLNITDRAGSARTVTITPTAITGLTGGTINFTSVDGQFALVGGAIGGISIITSNTGSDTFMVQGLDVDDTLNIQGLGGDDLFQIGNGVAGDALFDGGQGSDTYNFQFGSTSAREIVINDSGTSGVDTLDLVGSDGNDNIAIFTDRISDGISTLRFNVPLTVIEISGLAGNDTFTINGSLTSVVTLFGDVGNDTFIVNNSNGVDDVNLFGGVGNDSFQLNGSSAATRIDALGSEGDDTYVVGSGASGNLFLDGEAGSDRYTVTFAGQGARRISTRDTGAGGNDVTEVFGTAGDDRVAVRTTRFLYDDEVVIFDESTERVSLQSLGGIDRIVVFGSRSALTEVFAGAGDDNFIINGGSRADVINLNGDEGNDIFLVRKTSEETITNLLGGLGNDRFNVGSTGNQDDGNLGLIRGELNIVGGANDAGQEDQLLANDSGVDAAYSYRVTPTQIAPIVGPGGLDRSFFVGINYDATIELVRLDGTPRANLFEVTASPTTRFFIDGNAPTSVGDRLNITFQSNDGRQLFVTNAAQGAGFVTFTNGNEMVQFDSIETTALGSGPANLTVPDDFEVGLDEFFATFDFNNLIT